MIKSHPHKYLFLWVLPICLTLASCSKKETIPLEPIPAMTWQAPEVVPFIPMQQWQNQPLPWNDIYPTLENNIDIPQALETKLQREEREIWKSALQNMEFVQNEKDKIRVLARTTLEPSQTCVPPSSAFSLHQRSQLQLALQLHRNVLWRLGRLEMASRGVSHALHEFLQMFSGGRIKDADQAIVAPIQTFQEQLKLLQNLHPVPKGDWMPGDIHPRAARTSHPEGLMLQLHTQLLAWNNHIVKSERWAYLAGTHAPVIQAVETWKLEFKELSHAYKNLAEHLKTLERDFAPPHALVAWPCIRKNLNRMRIVTELYSHILPMQWALSNAYDAAHQTKEQLTHETYRDHQPAILRDEILHFQQQLESQKNKLSRVEDMLLIALDDTARQIWQGLPDFIDPIHHKSAPAVEDANSWLVFYKELQNELKSLPSPLKPEPEQPLNKRGKTAPTFITEVLEILHAPSRIDEAERSLLAISELEAHMVSIRDELLRLCKQGACRSFPEAELANSPRTSAWIVSWRQSPSHERTLGHTLIVIKLCQLHLSRLVQRLTEIYAWFSETSNADLSWKKLKSWQRIWTLYAEPNGTYASFLKSIAALDTSISEMAIPKKKRAQSEELLQLLAIQDKFFDLTLDYARFIDAKSSPPASFDELVATWEELDEKFVQIEKITLERDIKNNPELIKQIERKSRKRAEIPR